MRIWLAIFFFLHLSVLYIAQAVDIGSDAAVARFNTQQELDNGDRIAGFAAIEAGFALKGAFVSGTFDCLFPVTGRIDLNGGTLILDKNICLDHVSDFAILGNITGKNRLVDFSSSVTAVSSLSDDVFNCTLFSLVEVASGEPVRSVDWSWDSQYLAVSTDPVIGSALSIYDFDGTSSLSLLLTTSIDVGATLVNEVRWHPSKYLLAAGRNGTGLGDEVFTFSFVPGTNELIQLSSDEISNRVKAVAWHPSGDYLAIGGVSNAAEIIIYPVDANGILDTAGRYVENITGGAQNVGTEALDWDLTGNYLAVGYDTDSHLEVYAFTPSPLGLTLNASQSANSIDGLDWNPTFSWIFSAGVATGENIRVYAHDNVTGGITELVGESLGVASKSNDWHPNGDCLAVGNDTVSSIGSLRSYHFNKDVPSLTEATKADFSQNVAAVRWAPNGLYLANGSQFDLAVYGLIRNHCSTFDNVHLMMGGPLTFRNCCIHFSGDCSIDGGGHQLTLEKSCVLQVEDNARLHFANMTIKKVTTEKLKMAGSGSSLLFEDVHMKIGSKFSINKGYFDVLGTLRISGSDKRFVYGTDQVSTIRERSELILDEDLTFSYDATAPNLLKFQDSTSRLVLSGATLHATSTGLELITGKLKVIENSALSSEIIRQGASLIDNGITLGSGVQADDMKVIILPNLELACSQGSIKYKNVGTNSLKMRNNFSRFHFNTGTAVWLYENMDVRPGFIEFDDQTRLLTAPGITLTGSIVPRGALQRTIFIP